MLPIKEDDKLFSKVLSKETSIANPSFRVYYGGNSVAVPFVWEAKPGTPKHPKHNVSESEEENNYIPPLTPPPSYYLRQPKNLPSSKNKSKVFQGLFPRIIHRRQTSTMSSLSSSSTLSCSSLSTSVSDSTTMSFEGSRSRSRSRTLSSPRSLFDFVVSYGHAEEEEEEEVTSPKSILCFGAVGSRRIRAGPAVVHKV